MATPHTQATPRLTPAKRAATYLGIPYSSLRKLAFDGEFPIVRVGRAWYIETATLDRWIETRRESAAV
jgi:excisionase family DNA binding protein